MTTMLASTLTNAIKLIFGRDCAVRPFISATTRGKLGGCSPVVLGKTVANVNSFD